MNADLQLQYKQLVHRILKSVANTNSSILRDLKTAKFDRTKIGATIAFFALARLVQSFRGASALISKRYTFEATVVMRLIFEQLAWVLAIHGKTDKRDIRRLPTECVSTIRNSIPFAGRLYGQLSDFGHMNPKYIRDYLQFDLGETNVHVYVRPAKLSDAAQFALVLLLLSGLYGLMAELLNHGTQKKYRFLSRQEGVIDLSKRFIKRCAVLQSRLDKLNLYSAHPPKLRLVHSRGDKTYTQK
jgi:hypothetical protein